MPNYLVLLPLLAPVHLALVAGVGVVLLRARNRRAAGLAAAGFLLALAGSVAHFGNLPAPLYRNGILRDWAYEEPGYRLARAAYAYGSAAGFGLVIAAAFVGRRPRGGAS